MKFLRSLNTSGEEFFDLSFSDLSNKNFSCNYLNDKAHNSKKFDEMVRTKPEIINNESLCTQFLDIVYSCITDLVNSKKFNNACIEIGVYLGPDKQDAADVHVDDSDIKRE